MAPNATQERLSIDEFFTRLAALLSAATDAHKHSIFLSQKPLPPSSSPDVSLPDLLVRATNGATKPTKPKSGRIEKPSAKGGKKGDVKKEQEGMGKGDGGEPRQRVKIATVVPADALDAFYVRYAEVMKAGMGSLKKRDRKKRKGKGKKPAAAAT